jgi:hypothetical protein
MTGYYIRIERDGEWQNLDVAELTDAELDFWQEQSPIAGWHWAKVLARWIRDNVKTERRPE